MAVLKTAVASPPIPDAIPTAAVSQMPAAVVSPFTSSSALPLMIVPAPKKPIPATKPCSTRVKPEFDSSRNVGQQVFVLLRYFCIGW